MGQKITEPGKGYVDGIKESYSPEELTQFLLKERHESLGNTGPFEGRAYILLKELPDANVCTSLRPEISIEVGRPVENHYKDHYSYFQKNGGCKSYVHRNVVENSPDWFSRIK